MKLVLASDHAGYELKNELVGWLTERGYETEDLGPHLFEPGDDYPTYIIPLARKVAENKDIFGIIIGFSGQGEAIAANRVSGARAALYYGGSDEILKLSRAHNNANILSIGSHFVDHESAKNAILLWINTPFTSEERHLRRIHELDA